MADELEYLESELWGRFFIDIFEEIIIPCYEVFQKNGLITTWSTLQENKSNFNCFCLIQSMVLISTANNFPKLYKQKDVLMFMKIMAKDYRDTEVLGTDSYGYDEEEIRKDIHNKFFRYEDALLDATKKNLEDSKEIAKIAFEPYESILKKRGQYELQKKKLHLSFLESYSLIKDTLPSIAQRHQA